MQVVTDEYVAAVVEVGYITGDKEGYGVEAGGYVLVVAVEMKL